MKDRSITSYSFSLVTMNVIAVKKKIVWLSGVFDIFAP